MNAAELIRFFGKPSYSPFGETRADQVVRSLRLAGLVPVGGRGPSAVKIEALHAAHVLLGLNSATAADASTAALAWGNIRPRERLPSPFGKCNTLLEFLEHALSGASQADSIESVLINIDWPEAVARFRKSKREVTFGDSETSRRIGFRTYPIRRLCSFSGSIFSQLVLELERPEKKAHQLRKLVD